ncbi:hypothetical protein PROFUN_16606 [Planoprotostelium fungivorum]|uniref:SAP domain-containing protein n=1 Tax=Planoprotostelium fungivorum TaxID=1890364 RepID=A0A2P6MQ92_9EUKA|nr:hypothetical protein PROFUN_16606 [Planoprotostelium fungivorum]
MSPKEFIGCTLMSNEEDEDRQDRYVWSQAIVYCLKNSKQAETSDEDSEEEYSDFSGGEQEEEQREAQMFAPLTNFELIVSGHIEELREKLKERGLDVDESKSEFADRLVDAMLLMTLQDSLQTFSNCLHCLSHPGKDEFVSNSCDFVAVRVTLPSR